MMRKKTRARVLDAKPSTVARHLTEVCAELGPAFIKLGQLASTRPDIVPAEVLSQLRTLQDDVPPFDSAVAMKVIAEELGAPVEECFASIEATPIASGSIGQVYRAKAKDGTELVVKVQRPGVAEEIQLDMQLLAWLAESLETLIPELKVYRPTILVAELEETLTRELDYINEASATARFAKAFADDSAIRIPRVYWDFCGPRVLTLESLSGTNIDKLALGGDCEGAVWDRKLVARTLVDAYLKQVFELGVFHADPHPGNILVDPSGSVGLIDFGQVGTITEELMTELIVIVYACVNNELDVVVDALADMDALGPETERRHLQRELQVLLHKYYGLPLKRFDLSALVNEFSDVVRRHDVVIPRDMLMLLKTVAVVKSVAATLDPELDLVELVRPRLKKTLGERFSPPQLLRGASKLAWHAFSIARRAPGQLREGLRRVGSGHWRLNIRHENIDRLVNELDRSSNRLSFSIVIAAIIIGSSVVVSTDTQLALMGIRVQDLGILGYVIAGILGLTLIWAIFRSGRLH
ncbi:MAG: AarF/ABC1/UbiB kinase family protein [Phycisphaerales bacterium]|nr:MAG: AarF/ABC1/UbiB kinase family protein [Phycisphaerales bacterium]